MKIVEADGFQFRFSDAIDAFVFDEKDKTKITFHGAPMKGVDIVAEFESAYVYVEMKDYEAPLIYDLVNGVTEDEIHARQDSFKWLKNYLKYKYRDSYLYRYAEQKVEKPVHYVCLITFDNALNSRMQKALKQELPVGRASRRWVKDIVSSCQVVNIEKWNENFPKWPVKRLDEAT
ncbi:hypothetical protein [Vampirovibrio sp.]|uniref:hypothetical protein n=1 Tax=Vampirovibrio sp. TaxID=2717857 RepID=UPI0035941E7C